LKNPANIAKIQLSTSEYAYIIMIPIDAIGPLEEDPSFIGPLEEDLSFIFATSGGIVVATGTVPNRIEKRNHSPSLSRKILPFLQAIFSPVIFALISLPP